MCFFNAVVRTSLVDPTVAAAGVRSGQTDLFSNASAIPLADVPEVELLLADLPMSGIMTEIPVSITLVRNLRNYLPRRFQNGR